MTIDSVLIQANNQLILSGFSFQPRHVPEPKPKVEYDENDGKFMAALAASKRKLMFKEVKEMIKLSAGQGDRIRDKLLAKGMITVVDVIKGHGGKKTYPMLLSPGYKHLGIEEPKFEGKGCGYEHLLYQYLFRDHFEEFNPEIELIRNGKSIDVAFEINGKLIAIEVAITAGHEKVNLEKDVCMAKAHCVIIGCKDEKVKQQVLREISSLPLEIQDKSFVCRLSEVFKVKPETLVTNIGGMKWKRLTE